MAKHPLEKKYGLSSAELLDAIDARFRLKVAVEGAVAELQMAKHIGRLVGSTVERYEQHDVDGHPDFTIWIPGRRKPLLAECKNIRESSKPGGEAYRVRGEVVAYKVETQKTRAAKGDPTSRFYDFDQFHILGVCLGKKTGDWTDFLFARTLDLERHPVHSQKLKVLQRVPLPDAKDLRLGMLILPSCLLTSTIPHAAQSALRNGVRKVLLRGQSRVDALAPQRKHRFGDDFSAICPSLQEGIRQRRSS